MRALIAWAPAGYLRQGFTGMGSVSGERGLRNTYRPTQIIRPDFKKNLFPVERPVSTIVPTGNFLNIFCIFFSQKMNDIFLPKKKKVKKGEKCGRPTSHIIGHLLHWNQILFLAGLRVPMGLTFNNDIFVTVFFFQIVLTSF